jgi:hypothetical protein
MGQLNDIHNGMEVTGLYVISCDPVSDWSPMFREDEYSTGHCLAVVEFYGKGGEK